MKLFDSHCHLDDRMYENDIDEIISRAFAAGVEKMMTVGINRIGSERSVVIAESYPGVCASVGIHPHDASTCSETTLHRLQDLARHAKVRAWGEIGLDYNRMHSPKTDQEKWFRRQLEIAHVLDLPMIFHERDSNGRFLDILKSGTSGAVRGVVHCFTGTAAELDEYIKLGLHIGITGILTIKGRGARLRELVLRIPAERLLVETDAPYLTPTPERNRVRRNEPAFVATVLKKLAEVRGEDPAGLSKKIWENTCSLFGIRD